MGKTFYLLAALMPRLSQRSVSAFWNAAWVTDIYHRRWSHQQLVRNHGLIRRVWMITRTQLSSSLLSPGSVNSLNSLPTSQSSGIIEMPVFFSSWLKVATGPCNEKKDSNANHLFCLITTKYTTNSLRHFHCLPMWSFSCRGTSFIYIFAL